MVRSAKWEFGILAQLPASGVAPIGRIGNRIDYLLAGFMAKWIIELLEVININHQW